MRPIHVAIAGLILAAGATAVLIPPGDDLAAGLDRAKAAPPAPLAATRTAPQDLDRLLQARKRIGIDRLAGDDWAVACLSRGAHPAPAAMAACWPAQAERNMGGSFVNVVGKDGTCGQWRTTRPVIDRRFEDSLCLARAEVPQLSLRDAGRIVDIE